MSSPLEEFLQACEEQVIYIEDGALQDASNDFKLHTAEEVMIFICSLGSSGLTAKNCCPLEKPRWPPPPPPSDVMVYAYTFWAAKKEARKSYLAFFKNPITGILFLKSFKMDKLPDRNFAFRKTELLEFRKRLPYDQKPDSQSGSGEEAKN